MRSLEELRAMLADGAFSFSRHAFRRAVERNIAEDEIREAGRSALLVEDYPDDKYSASCLLLGRTARGRALHLHVSRAQADTVRIITLYEPDATAWDETFLQRR